jgi:hypothetical protein
MGIPKNVSLAYRRILAFDDNDEDEEEDDNDDNDIGWNECALPAFFVVGFFGELLEIPIVGAIETSVDTTSRRFRTRRCTDCNNNVVALLL